MQDAYKQGFINKCAELGIDPALLIKTAQTTNMPPSTASSVWSKIKGFGRKAVDSVITNADGSSVLTPKPPPPPPPKPIKLERDAEGTWVITNK